MFVTEVFTSEFYYMELNLFIVCIFVSMHIVETSPALYLQRFSFAYSGVVFNDGCRDVFVNASFKLDLTTVAVQTSHDYVTIGSGDTTTTMALSIEDVARGAIDTVSFCKLTRPWNFNSKGIVHSYSLYEFCWPHI